MNAFGKAQGGGRRQSARQAAPQLAVLSTIASDRRVGLVNVSSQGVRLIAPDMPAEGEDVIFEADSLQMFGRVAWASDGQCGIAFATPITPDQVERLRSEAIAPL